MLPQKRLSPWLLRLGKLLRQLVSFRLGLDVDIRRLGISIELGSIPNQTGFGNESQYQIHCLDIDEITR